MKWRVCQYVFSTHSNWQAEKWVWSEARDGAKHWSIEDIFGPFHSQEELVLKCAVHQIELEDEVRTYG